MNRRFALKAVSAAVALSAATSLPVWAQSTIKVGVLHSLSGTMAISETVLKDTVLMAIDEINASGGVLGKKLEIRRRTGPYSPRRRASWSARTRYPWCSAAGPA
jgi:ABC-type branched-subunit amino acid transport system substrate-binding protein